MRVVRYELRSAAELDTLARAPLPLGIHAAKPRAASHRDLYLDTRDDALRERGVVCRLRIGTRPPHRLTLVLGGEGQSERVEATVRETTADRALAADTAVRRRGKARSIASPRCFDISRAACSSRCGKRPITARP